MSAPTNEAGPARLARFKQYLLAEWEAAALYRALADAEQNDERAAVLRELASMEDRHAAHWRAKLDEAGEPLPAWRPSLRSRFLGRLARLFGTTSVLPILERFEGGDAAMYAAEPESLDFSTQERVHGRVFQRLRKGEQTGMSDIARREERHRGAGSGRLRAAVFGVNDGLVSNLSLVMGVAGAEPGPRFVLLAGIAGLLAGAFSMATGEYVSMRVQREMLERELDVERAELEEHPEEEEEELALIYRAKGLPPEEAARVAKRVIADKEVALETLAREELGLDPGELGSPWGAAISSFLAFAVGAFVPVLPYLLSRGPYALALSGALSAVALAAVGALTALLTGRSVGFATARMVLLGAASATVTFWVGRLLGVAIS
ncbi:MAG TPA: VIT1/CCC1 family protein [Dehalococcoidia bacterium]|nr:VIT1/CCC1 family protein [Dehalococcoidia bacterium]